MSTILILHVARYQKIRVAEASSNYEAKSQNVAENVLCLGYIMNLDEGIELLGTRPARYITIDELH
jgi:hypothetical protein